MFKKICIIVLVILCSLSFLSFNVLADEEKDTLKTTSVKITEAIKNEPVNIGKYFNFTVDFVSELISRLLKTGKLVYIVKPGIGGFQVVLIEGLEFPVGKYTIKYNIAGGLTEENQFLAVEVTNMPLTGDLYKIFRKVHPELFYVFDKQNGNYFSFGLTYEFRD